MSDLLYYLKSEMLESELEAARLREAEWNETLTTTAKVVCELTQERDAALSALEIARNSLRCGDIQCQFIADYIDEALRPTVTPSAALAERDRAKGDE